MDLEGNVFNEAEELSNLSAAEPTENSITKKSKKTGKHRGRNELRGDLETKEIVHTLPEDQRKCAVCGGKLVPFSKEYITTRLCIIPAKIFKITYFREVYKCEHCDKHGDKANIVKAPNLTAAPVIPRGLPEAELIAYIAEAKYLLPLRCDPATAHRSVTLTHLIPKFLRNDRLMIVFNDHPLRFIVADNLVILVAYRGFFLGGYILSHC